MVASMPVAHLADRFGVLRIFSICYLLRAAGILGYLLVNGSPALIVFSAAFGAIDRSCASITKALIGLPLPREERGPFVAGTALPCNVGMALGAGCGALFLIRLGMLPAVIVLDAVSFIAVVMLYRAYRGWPPEQHMQAQTPLLLNREAWRTAFSGHRIGIAAANCLLSLHRTGLTVGIPLWVLANPTLNSVWVPAAVGINGVIVAGTQGAVARMITNARRAWAGWAACAAGLIVMFALLRYTSSDTTSLVVVALVLLLVQTTVELLHTSATLWLSFEAARESHMALDLSVVNLGGQLQNIVGPVVLVAVVGASPSCTVIATLVGIALLLTAIALLRQTTRAPRDTEVLIQ
jgi:predicted MFS family arabinose efflux permease